MSAEEKVCIERLRDALPGTRDECWNATDDWVNEQRPKQARFETDPSREAPLTTMAAVCTKDTMDSKCIMDETSTALASTEEPRSFRCSSLGEDFSFGNAYRQLWECNFYAVGTMRTPLVVDPTAECGWQFAKMGKGVETVLDLSARNTLVAANPPKIDIAEMPVMLESLRQQVLPWLEPGLLRADLHSVLMYNEGSFFKSHRDAPKSASHLLTLSVEAQSLGRAEKGFEGGRLILKKNAPSKTIGSWYRRGFPADERGVGSWNAWFNSTYHEITPLTAGSSIRAIFNVSLDCPLDSARASKFHRVEGSSWTEAVDVIASHLEDNMEGSFLFLDQYLGSPKDEQPLAFFPSFPSRKPVHMLHPVQLIGADRLFFEAAKLRFPDTTRIRPVNISTEQSDDFSEVKHKGAPRPFRNLYEDDTFKAKDLFMMLEDGAGGAPDSENSEPYAGNSGGEYCKYWSKFAVEF